MLEQRKNFVFSQSPPPKNLKKADLISFFYVSFF